MNIYAELLLVAVVVVYVVDVSGATETLLGLLSRFTRRFGLPPVRSFRPFTCSLCMVWWCCLAWALIRGQLTLPTVAASAALSSVSKTLCAVFIFIRESTAHFVDKLTDLCTRY